jgi:hypothetical protein
LAFFSSSQNRVLDTEFQDHEIGDHPPLNQIPQYSCFDREGAHLGFVEAPLSGSAWSSFDPPWKTVTSQKRLVEVLRTPFHVPGFALRRQRTALFLGFIVIGRFPAMNDASGHRPRPRGPASVSPEVRGSSSRTSWTEFLQRDAVFRIPCSPRQDAPNPQTMTTIHEISWRFRGSTA